MTGARLGAAPALLLGLVALCAPTSAFAAGAGGPVNLAPPAITGTAEPGQTLTCSQGTWGGAIDSYSYQWNRNGAQIVGANSSAHVVAADDVSQQITCTVTATDFAGSSAATSAAVTPSAGGSSGGGAPGGPGAPGTEPLPSPATVIEFPPAKKARSCASRRSFKIRIKQIKGVGYTSAAVFVNGKQTKVVKGNRLTAPVNLRGLPQGTFTAKIVVTTNDGRTITGSRKYKTCAKKRGPKGKKHRL